MTHLRCAKPAINERGEMLARCGRYVRESRTATSVREAECKHCLEAFARILRALPDAFPADQTEASKS